MECFGLGGIFRGHPAQPPCSEQGHLHLGQAAQSPIQPGLECFQGWGIDHLSGLLGVKSLDFASVTSAGSVFFLKFLSLLSLQSFPEFNLDRSK